MTREGDLSNRPTNGTEGRLSRAGVGRLSLYLHRLESLLRAGTTKVSSSLLGESLGVTDAQVRKDLAYLGNLGHPGIGYAAPEVGGRHEGRRARGRSGDPRTGADAGGDRGRAGRAGRLVRAGGGGADRGRRVG